ncbi:MAG TPA: hypothetical protein VJ302_18810 [Blastocatellia bacterium]|nr:hypothetical protein [Blastocatellia bacterium]
MAKFVTKFEVSEASGQFGQTLFVPETETAFFLFQLLLNRPALFQAVREITGCSPIGHFLGRLHRSSPGLQHQIDWHEDHGVQRLVGISISLSREAYTGGLFQLREKRSEQVLCVIGQLPIGDAFLFDIDPDFQHRLTLVEAGGERTVGVGWFHSVEAWPTFARDYLLPGRRHSDSHQPEI